LITKETIINKTEIQPDGTILISEKTKFLEDDVFTGASSLKRRVIEPGDDYSGEEVETKAIADLVQTKEKIDTYKEKHKAK